MAGRNRIVEILLKANVLDDLQLRSATAHQERWGGRFTSALIELGLADDQDVADAIALAVGLPRLVLGNLAKDSAALSRIPVGFAESRAAFPVALKDQGKTLVLAVADPTDLTLLDDAAALAHARLQPGVSGELEIARAVARLYRGVELPDRASRARAAVQRSQRHTSDENPVVVVGADSSQEQEFSPESLSKDPGASQMLEEMLAASNGPAWTQADRDRLRLLRENQAKSSRILEGILELLVEKGLLQERALLAWRRGEPLPPLPHLGT
jgi:hypothetical protein